MEQEKRSFYRENVPDLIADLKVAVANNREVITKAVTGDLSEDRYVNVLKARRMAAEDSLYFMREIDRLEGEINGTIDEGEGNTKTPSQSWPKRMAQQNK